MFLTDIIQNIITAASDQLITWATKILPQVFLFLIFLNAITRMIGRARIEKLAARCGSNCLLRYMVLPFLSAVVLGNPMAISMGRYLPEEYKPAYFASVSYHCHTNSGIFQHINPAELFLWLGIANGVLALRLDIFPLAARYMCAGLVANFLSGYATEIITRRMEKKKHIQLATKVDLRETVETSAGNPAGGEVSRGSSSDGKTHTYSSNDVNVVKSGSFDMHDTEKLREDDGDTRFHSITITRGSGGYGGPVTVTPTEERHIVLYMTGGGTEPEPLAKILELSGMEAVNGNTDVCPDEKVALAIIDCGGTLRCGIYPGKGIPTVNVLAAGRSGPLAKYMTEDLYVSAVTSAEVCTAAEARAENIGDDAVDEEAADSDSTAWSSAASARVDETDGKSSSGSSHGGFLGKLQAIFEPLSSVSRIVSIFYQSARDAVGTCLNMLLPFMGFAALFIGICRGSGLTEFLAGLIEPVGGSLPGLFVTGILCSVPGLSAILGAGAVAAQIFATVIGDLIITGDIAPSLALPALFAINCQCACDFIPVGLGMMEAKGETVQMGMTAVTLSRFATGWLRIIIALVFSIGLYA